MNLDVYLGLLAHSEKTLAESLRQVSAGHGAEPDVHFICQSLATQSDHHGELLDPVIQRYGGSGNEREPERLHAQGLSTTRSGPVGLLRDLQDVFVLASLVDITWTVVEQAGQALRDEELLSVVEQSRAETQGQLRWLRTRIKQASPQALLVAE
ncbi:hypothetical protein ACIPY0_01425 [Paenarthrobacter nicotinovorans]|jgi:hypothetical protein|uniref:hypothetical protein n=1 Tax=Paenarthrobacter nicotinovorans TaxID=29320 RepID=UPI0038023910